MPALAQPLVNALLVEEMLARQDAKLPIESAKAMIHHPLGRLPSQALVMVGDGQGGMISTRMLPQGRWRVELSVAHGGDEARYRRDLK